MAKVSHPQSEELDREVERLRNENAELRKLLGSSGREPSRNYQLKSDQHPLNLTPTGSLTTDSATADKIALFRNLFRGRDDVYAVFWSNERTGKKGYSPAIENPWNSGLPRTIPFRKGWSRLGIFLCSGFSGLGKTTWNAYPKRSNERSR